MRCTLGVSLHSGWAIGVAVTGAPSQPEIVLRRQLDLVDPALPSQVFHVAAGQVPARAEDLIRRVERSARNHAEREVVACVDLLAADGYDLEAVALCAEPRDLPHDLPRILANHTLIHTAEGELYREAVESAAVEVDLPVLQIDAKRIAAEAADQLGIGADRQKELLDALGRQLGPPWRIDHKRATLAAMLALADLDAVATR